MARIVTAPDVELMDIVDGLGNTAAVPISTVSRGPGGVFGVPLTVVQFPAVSHLESTACVHRTVPDAMRKVCETSGRKRREKKRVNCFMAALLGLYPIHQ